jgi:hypothetical protein
MICGMVTSNSRLVMTTDTAISLLEHLFARRKASRVAPSLYSDPSVAKRSFSNFATGHVCPLMLVSFSLQTMHRQ